MSSHDTNEEMEDIRNEIFSYDASFVEYTIEGHSDSDIEKIVENVINQFKDLILDVVSNHITHETRTIAKNDLAVDCIDKTELLKAMDTWDKFGYTARYGLERLDKDDKGFVPYVKYDDMVNCVKNMPSVTPQEPRCKECKWWKDSDGTYRRGIGAESRCPINHIEVLEGNGYCFLFEPQESEDKE